MELKTLTIVQLNCHKSAQVMHALLNDEAVYQGAHVLCLQEPFSRFDNLVGHHNWVAYGKSGEYDDEALTTWPRKHPLPRYPRVLTYINKNLLQSEVSEVGAFHPDAQSIAIAVDDSTDAGQDEGTKTIVIHNLYNLLDSEDTTGPMWEGLQWARREITGEGHIVVGDFNAHHPWWESGISHVTAHADRIASTMASLELELLTPTDSGTYLNHQGTDTTIDLIWADEYIGPKVIECTVAADWSSGSDHQAVRTTFSLAARTVQPTQRHNMKACDGPKLSSTTRSNWETRWLKLAPVEEDPESWAEALTQATQEAIEATVPRTRPSPHSRPWFHPNIGHIRAAANKLRRRYQQMRTPEAWEAHCRMRNALKTAIRSAKKRYENALLSTPGKDLWKVAQRGRTTAQATNIEALEAQDGRLTTAPITKEHILRAQFFPPVRQLAEATTQHGDTPSTWEWEEITAGEVHRRIQKASRDTAPGIDGIPWSAHKILDQHWPYYSALLAHIFNNCIKHSIHPAIYKRARTVILRKPQKPDYSQAKAYRPITLLPTTAKLFEGIMAARILQCAETVEGVLAEEHIGGRPSRSAEDATLMLQQWVKDQQAKRKDVAILTVDVAGAYNDVQKAALQQDMKESGWPSELREWVASFMEGRKTRMRLGDYEGEEFETDSGLPQGSPISQALWMCYSRGLVRAGSQNRRRPDTLSIGWVDDWTVAVAGKSNERIEEILAEVTSKAEDWRAAHAAQFDPGKSNVMAIQRRGGEELQLSEVHIGDQPIEQVDSVKILGVHFSSDGRFKEHAEKVAARATRQMGLLMKWGNRANGMTWQAMRQLYIGGVVPGMTYAATTWLPAEDRNGRVGLLTKLNRVQRFAAISITGAYRSTSNTALEHEADLLPIPQLFKQAHARSLLRLKQVPKSHPMASRLQTWMEAKRKRHRTPIRAIALDSKAIAHANVGRNHIRRPPNWQPANAHIAPSKDEAMEQHRLATRQTGDANIYTDGSKSDSGVGCAAVWPITDGKRIARRALRPEAGIFEAEVQAIGLAAEMILESTETPTTIRIWSDSQAAVRAITSAKAVEPRVRKVQDDLERAAGNAPVEIHWLPGHEGVDGNEQADLEARAAAMQSIPRRERRGSRSPGYYRAKIRRHALRQWQRAYDRGKATQLKATVGTTSVGQMHKVHRGLNRAQTSIITQLRTGHIALGGYLARRRVRETGRCTCGHHLESVQHFLLSCSDWAHRRRELERRVGFRARSTRALLGSNKAEIIKAVAWYAKRRIMPNSTTGE